MKIIENITKHEIAGGLKETGDPLDPYGISETEARKWDEPRDFWDVLKDPLWREWIKAIRKEMQGFEENNVFLEPEGKTYLLTKR